MMGPEGVNVIALSMKKMYNQEKNLRNFHFIDEPDVAFKYCTRKYLQEMGFDK